MADRHDDIKARLLAIFQVEAEEHIQSLTANLLALERGLPPAEAQAVVETMFREVHTLKGAARSVSLLDMEALCQALESVLSRNTQGALALDSCALHLLQAGVDGGARLLAGGYAPATLSDLIRRLKRTAELTVEPMEPIEASGNQAETLATAVAPVLPPTDTIRVATAALDALLRQAEDLLAPKLAAEERVREARALVEALTRCRTTSARTRTAYRSSRLDEHDADLLGRLDAALRPIEALARELLAHLIRDARTMAGAVDGLLDAMRRMRMLPAATILELFPRMVRDLAEEQGKEVAWMAQGADLEVDRKVLEAMKEPLIHLVRNAIDHGIETPEVRGQAGKPRGGQVSVTVALLEGNRIELCVEDDGSGIDPARVRAAAVRGRLLTTEEGEALGDAEALQLIYRSGLSTSPMITDVSGHGLGLAIVRERVERLGGQISLETQVGVGTTVRMILPASIATFRGLLLRAGGQPYLLPTDAVERAIRLAPERVERVEGREMIREKGYPLSLTRLSRLLGRMESDAPPEPASKAPCVIVRSGAGPLGLLVDEILGEQEVLVKEFGPPLVRVRNIAGAGLLGTGQLVLILRPADLLRSIRETPPRSAATVAPQEKARQPVLLVADDSITTRMMEKNLLEAVGYQVRVAVDGMEAWTLLKSEAFDLVVSDVDMPRMDGLELTARIRADRQLADLPVVLVTALETREDKERGIEVGANAYIVKSSFDQSNLLEIIRRLL